VDKNRFIENKRAVEDKYLGPLVKTSMNRCIHCTRCVRFTTEVAGVEEMGAIGRGEDTEITTYLEKSMSSELQGNVIDLCPVGALTSKPYEFKARPWELRNNESIDVMDAVGSAIRIDVRGREVMRILPRQNDDVNEEWISDKTRFVWDGLKSQRLDQPYIRENGKLRPAAWNEALSLVAAKLKAAGPEKSAALIGDLNAVEEIFALKELMSALGVKNVDCREAHSALGVLGGRAGYLFNASIAAIDDADSILIVGSNPRTEAAVLNARIRKAWKRGAHVGVIGEKADLSYEYIHLGNGPETLAKLGNFAEVLKSAKKPLIILGQGAIARADGVAVLSLAAKTAQDLGVVKDGWNGFCVLHTAAARAGALEVCALPTVPGGKSTAEILDGSMEAIWLLGADEHDLSKIGNAFVIYQGTHGDAGAHRADVILPGAAYSEKSGTYVNTEGRVQIARRASFPPGDAREDWAIIRAASEALGATLPFNTLEELRACVYQGVPHLSCSGQLIPADPAGLDELAKAGGKLGSEPFVSAVKDFYFTNPIARASRIMAACAQERARGFAQAAE
jgi:NADH-quinone oxidoreductase subunit G